MLIMTYPGTPWYTLGYPGTPMEAQGGPGKGSHRQKQIYTNKSDLFSSSRLTSGLRPHGYQLNGAVGGCQSREGDTRATGATATLHRPCSIA
jgi:hypothetical protein